MDQVHYFGLNLGAQAEHLMCAVSAKIPELGGSISPSNFMGNCRTIGHTFSLIYPVYSCPFKEMKTWGQSEKSFYCFVFSVN